METIIYLLIGLAVIIIQALQKAKEQANQKQGGQVKKPPFYPPTEGSPQERPQAPVEKKKPAEYQTAPQESIEKTRRKVLEQSEMPQRKTFDEIFREIQVAPQSEFSEENLVVEAGIADRAVPEHIHGKHHALASYQATLTKKGHSRVRRLLTGKNDIRRALIIREIIDPKHF